MRDRSVLSWSILLALLYTSALRTIPSVLSDSLKKLFGCVWVNPGILFPASRWQAWLEKFQFKLRSVDQTAMSLGHKQPVCVQHVTIYENSYTTLYDVYANFERP